MIISTNPPMAKPVLNLLGKLRIIPHEEVEDHEQYFTKSDLGTMLKIAGFKNIQLKYFNLGFNILAIAYKL